MSQFQDIFPSNYKGKKKRKSRADSDEYYVIDLCDEVLGRKASRQHRFDFLTGDTGKRLPVDAYYEELLPLVPREIRLRGRDGHDGSCKRILHHSRSGHQRSSYCLCAEERRPHPRTLHPKESP